MQLIPESIEALRELDPLIDDTELHLELVSHAAAVQSISPTCVGLSVATTYTGITFTLVATDEEIAALDGVQYLDGAPCQHAAETNRGVAAIIGDPLDEHGWQTFSNASAAAGIRSTLTIPIMEEGRATGTVNLYGSSEDTFDGHHRQIADVLGAWAPGAVTNADLSFTTRTVAEHAPEHLRERTQIDVAIGILAASLGVDVESAHRRLSNAAQRAGTSLALIAKILIGGHLDGPRPPDRGTFG